MHRLGSGRVCCHVFSVTVTGVLVTAGPWRWSLMSHLWATLWVYCHVPTVTMRQWQLTTLLTCNSLTHRLSKSMDATRAPARIVRECQSSAQLSCVKASRGGFPSLPDPNKLYGLCGRKATLNGCEGINVSLSTSNWLAFRIRTFYAKVEYVCVCRSPSDMQA